MSMHSAKTKYPSERAARIAIDRSFDPLNHTSPTQLTNPSPYEQTHNLQQYTPLPLHAPSILEYINQHSRARYRARSQVFGANPLPRFLCS